MEMNINLEYEKYVSLYTVTARHVQDEIIIFINEHYNENRQWARPSAKTDNDFDNVKIFYNRMCHRYPELINQKYIYQCLNGNMVQIGRLFNRLFNSVIVHHIVKKYEARQQDEAMERLLLKTQELFPTCMNLMRPIYEFNFRTNDDVNLVSMNEALGVYKELYNWLISYQV